MAAAAFAFSLSVLSLALLAALRARLTLPPGGLAAASALIPGLTVDAVQVPLLLLGGLDVLASLSSFEKKRVGGLLSSGVESTDVFSLGTRMLFGTLVSFSA